MKEDSKNLKESYLSESTDEASKNRHPTAKRGSVLSLNKARALKMLSVLMTVVILTMPSISVSAKTTNPSITASDTSVSYVNAMTKKYTKLPSVSVSDKEEESSIESDEKTTTISSYEMTEDEFKEYVSKLEENHFYGDIIRFASSVRDYEWYVDQGNSGMYSADNCGPAVATMVLKWAKPEIKKSCEDARNAYLLNGGWWYTNTIVDYLRDNGVECYYNNYLYKDSQIKNLINSDRIGILCINTFYLSFANWDNNFNKYSTIGKFYYGSVGHFVIVKGFVETTNDFYVEVYDPGSMDQKYEDGRYLGETRYYRLSELNECVRNRWSYMIVAEKSE